MSPSFPDTVRPLPPLTGPIPASSASPSPRRPHRSTQGELLSVLALSRAFSPLPRRRSTGGHRRASATVRPARTRPDRPEAGWLGLVAGLRTRPGPAVGRTARPLARPFSRPGRLEAGPSGKLVFLFNLKQFLIIDNYLKNASNATIQISNCSGKQTPPIVIIVTFFWICILLVI